MKTAQEIQETVSLVELAEAIGAKFKDRHRLRSRCPMPDHAGDRSSESFVIYDHERKWKCHSSCPSDRNGGDVISLYMYAYKVDFKTAILTLGGTCNLPPIHTEPIPVERSWAPSDKWKKRAAEFMAYAKQQMNDSVVMYLCRERGLSNTTIQAFQIGYNPTNLYDDPTKWDLDSRKVWLPRGIVIPGMLNGQVHYIKIRRPLQNDVLGNYIPQWTLRDGSPEVKFGGPRSGKTVLFRLELVDRLPVLVLTEGEWDAMLVWEHCADLCDIATLGGAQSKFDPLELAALAQYYKILVVHDDDKAGEKGREYIRSLQAISERFQIILPPAHDLTDFWKAGGDLRNWLAHHVSHTLEETLQWISPTSAQGIRCTKILSHTKEILHHR